MKIELNCGSFEKIPAAGARGDGGRSVAKRKQRDERNRKGWGRELERECSDGNDALASDISARDE